jgi:hypothetical protein
MSEGGLRIRSRRCSQRTTASATSSRSVSPSQSLYSTPERNYLLFFSFTLNFPGASCLCSMAVVQSRDLFLVFGSQVRSVNSWFSRSKSQHPPFHYSYQYFTLDGLQQLNLGIPVQRFEVLGNLVFLTSVTELV